MSMVSYAAGSRYLSLLGGVCMSFYDWYCDLPPPRRRPGASRPTCRNRPTGTMPASSSSGAPTCPRPARPTPISHRGALPRRQVGGDLPRLFGSLEVRRHLALGEAGNRRRPRHGHGPCHPQGIPRRPEGRLLPGLRPPVHGHADAGEAREAGRPPGAGPLPARLRLRRLARREQHPDWKTVAYDEASGAIVVPKGSVGFRWGEQGKWNLQEQESGGTDTKLRLSLAEIRDDSPRSPSPISAISSTSTSPIPTTPACCPAACR